jgi:hypothetical protein
MSRKIFAFMDKLNQFVPVQLTYLLGNCRLLYTTNSRPMVPGSYQIVWCGPCLAIRTIVKTPRSSALFFGQIIGRITRESQRQSEAL